MHIRLASDLFFRSFLGFGVAVAVAAFLQNEGVLFTHPSARVATTSFGIYDGCDDFVATDDVPLAVGQTFAWRVSVPDGQPVAWREELVLPSAPMTWSGAHFVDIRDDGRVAVTAGVDVPWEGAVEHAWSITEGDPAGDYELRLWIDGELHEVFDFHVE